MLLFISMDKDLLKELVEDGLTQNEISLKVNKSITSVRYWLNKFSFKTKFVENNSKSSSIKKCNRCTLKKDISEFYERSNGGYTAYCKPCTIKQSLERQRKFKKDCIEYKGGCCVKCGYNKCDAALEFHHLDPTQKDYTIANVRMTNFNDSVKSELDKCILVCANCHREIHSLNI